jgi:glycosyltransferase involved in cell wall biosynthesis
MCLPLNRRTALKVDDGLGYASMRILIINSEYPPIGGGAGNASANIAARFAHMGHEIAVVTTRFGKLPHLEHHKNLTLYRIPSLRQKQDRSNPFEQLVFLISASIWTLGMVLRFKPNATLAFFGVPSGAIAWLLKKAFEIPYIVSLRGGDVPGFRPYDFRYHHKILAPFLRLIWKDASTVVANSNGLRQLANVFDASFDIPIIPNGVDLQEYATEVRAWSPPRLLSVARLVHQKGLDLAMHALACLKDLEWEWCIAGDGPQINVLRTLANELGIQDRISFPGWRSHAELVECYKGSNLFLFPSRHEGMPNVVLEAMSSGLPIIASRIAGNEELILDGETGLLFPSEDVESLYVALRKLLTDASQRQVMGNASRRRVETLYSWENTAQQYTLLLERVK